jgi:hypothetical protein
MVAVRGCLPPRFHCPTDILINDRPFLITALLWLALTALIVYRGSQIEPYLPSPPLARRGQQSGLDAPITLGGCAH